MCPALWPLREHPRGGALHALAELEDGLHHLPVEAVAVVLQQGHQRVQVARLRIVGHVYAVARRHAQEALALQALDAVVHRALADVHGVRQLLLGGQLLADGELAGEDHVLQLRLEQLVDGGCADGFEFHVPTSLVTVI